MIEDPLLSSPPGMTPFTLRGVVIPTVARGCGLGYDCDMLGRARSGRLRSGKPTLLYLPSFRITATLPCNTAGSAL